MAERVEFAKLHGAGNDFVFIENLDGALTLDAAQVAALCDRHFGIGADGVILVEGPRDSANDGFMNYINADGSIAQMCGNGVRCFAKYVIDKGLVPPGCETVAVETRAGVKMITYTADEQGKLLTATVDMGAPELTPEKVPTTLAANAEAPDGTPFVRAVPVESPFGTFDFTCVSMGNPHAVAFVDDCDAIDIDKVGAYFESHEIFPEKANIEFACVREDGIHMRVYERGCGETLACGTGACATGVAAFLEGRAGRVNDLVLLGGTLTIEYTGETVLMTGPATEVYTGTVEL